MNRVVLSIKSKLTRPVTRRFSLDNYIKNPISRRHQNFLESLKNPNFKPTSHSHRWLIPLAIGTGFGLILYLSNKEVEPVFDYEKINERHYRLSDEAS